LVNFVPFPVLEQKFSIIIISLLALDSPRRDEYICSEGQETGAIMPASENARKKIGGAWSIAPINFFFFFG
jgi:hypothetical protein